MREVSIERGGGTHYYAENVDNASTAVGRLGSNFVRASSLKKKPTHNERILRRTMSCAGRILTRETPSKKIQKVPSRRLKRSLRKKRSYSHRDRMLGGPPATDEPVVIHSLRELLTADRLVMEEPAMLVLGDAKKRFFDHMAQFGGAVEGMKVTDDGDTVSVHGDYLGIAEMLLELGVKRLFTRWSVYAGFCPSNTYRAKMYYQADRLALEAEKFFQSFQTGPRERLELNGDPATLMPELLDKYRHVVVGEYHRHEQSSPKKLLIDNMAEFKRRGAVIALEHLPFEPYKRLLDLYYSSPRAEMPVMLERYLKGLDRMQGVKDLSYGYFALVKAAREKGVEILPIDTNVSYVAGYNPRSFESSGIQRMRAMNYMAKKVVDELGNGRQVVFLVGAAHTDSILDENESQVRCLGVADLFPNSVSLWVRDGEPRLTPDPKLQQKEGWFRADYLLET